jgi:hypothetical protein
MVFVSTDIISIMANEQFPMFHFWFTGDDNGTLAKFSLAYVAIAEFEDVNGDGAYQSNETLSFAPLAAYEWTLQTGSVQANGTTTEVWLKYTKGGARTDGMMSGMPGGGMNGSGSVEKFADVTIQIWAHIYLYDYQGNVSDDSGVRARYLVQGSSELKMDIGIGNFPFSTETSMVALQTLLRENEAVGHEMAHHHRYDTRERFRNNTGTSDMNWNREEGNETRFEDRNSTFTQRIDLIDDVTGVAQGFFSWVNKATITWPGGETEVVNVTASYVPIGHGLAVNLVYPNFDGGSILHDPSIGLFEDAATVTTAIPPEAILAVVLGVAVIVAVAVVLARRR